MPCVGPWVSWGLSSDDAGCARPGSGNKLCRHSRESGNPVPLLLLCCYLRNKRRWIPAFAGMTAQKSSAATTLDVGPDVRWYLAQHEVDAHVDAPLGDLAAVVGENLDVVDPGTFDVVD